MSDPHKFGLPTFEEFKKNPRKWKLFNPEGAITALQDGPRFMRKDLNDIRFFVHGKALSSENEVERALGDYGYTLADIDLGSQTSRLKKEIDMIPLGGGRYDIEVNFLPGDLAKTAEE